MRASHLGLTTAVVSLTLLVSACVDAPSAPDTFRGSGPFVIAPVFSLVGPSGPATSPSQVSALSDVFDRVDNFRMIVTRATNGEVILDVVIAVTPGSDEYDLQVDVTAAAGETLLVTLVALEGTTELFRAEAIPVQAMAPGSTGTTPPPPVSIPLTYTGPGATAVSVDVAPEQTVLGPGGTAQIGVKVLDGDGAVIAGAPVSWSSTTPGVATISASGVVTAVGDGVTEAVATSPTGLTDRAWIYVVSGTLAYVQDGVVKVRAPASGDPEIRSDGGGASGPSWAGGDLYYSEGGAVLKAGSSATLLGGSWPSVSPDGDKIAADAGGSIVFANIDGTNETAGPSGTTPVWTDWSTLVVGGGSIEEVQADGSARTTLVGGDASLPAFSNGGTLAWVSGGSLMVQGSATPLADVGGRPSWSPDGSWIVAPGGGGLLLVPTDGSAPPVPLPGLEGASDPAWQGTSPGGGSPPGLNLTGLDPDPAVPGQEVSILGSGFDWIIPENNRVFWPGPDGPLSGDVLSVTAGAIRSVLPRTVVAGQIRVENRQGNAVLAYVPSLGSLEIHASTPWGAPVAGVGITLLDGSGATAAAGTTDADGAFVVDALTPGAYTVQIGAPTGFNLAGASARPVTVPAAVSMLDLTLTPAIASVQLTPAQPTLGVLDEAGVTVQPFDVNGDPIPEVSSVSWGSASSRLDVWQGGLSTTIVGRQPSATTGDAGFSVTLDGRSFGFAATVTSSITGTITEGEGAAPVPGVTVVLERDETEIGRTTTDNAGRYRFTGLLAGTYGVKPIAPESTYVSPTKATVILGASTPRGQADFLLTEGLGEAKGEVIVLADVNYWGSGSSFDRENHEEMTRNFATNGTRSKTVWYRGHNSWLEGGSYAVTGYFAKAYDYITGTLEQTLQYVATGETGSLSIPDDAASFWIWMPQAAFDAADVGEINRYVAGGGRVILIGEHASFPTTNQRVQELMNALGSAGVLMPDCYAGKSSSVADDPLMAGVTAVETSCSSYFTAGAGDEPLAFQYETPIVMRLRLGSPVAGAPSAQSVSPFTVAPDVDPGDPSLADPTRPGVARRKPGGGSRR